MNHAIDLGAPNIHSPLLWTAFLAGVALVLAVDLKVSSREKTTFRALTEQGLRLVLKEKQAKPAHWKWQPLVVQGGGLTEAFKDATWQQIRDEIYRGHGA